MIHNGAMTTSTSQRLGPVEGMILERAELGPGCTLIHIGFTSRTRLADLKPGQFVQVHGFSGSDPLLRRPLAPFDVTRSGDGGVRLELMIQTVGRGTALLGEIPIGGAINVLGPLGRGFSPIAQGQVAIGAAGGVGLAPLAHLAAELMRTNASDRLELILGARDRTRLFGRERAEILGGKPLVVATDAGDAGFHGNAVQALRARLDAGARVDRILGCGPAPMLRALAELATERGIPCEVSLERRMACGFGVCYTCVVPVVGSDGVRRNLRSCLEGPVMAVEGGVQL